MLGKREDEGTGKGKVIVGQDYGSPGTASDAASGQNGRMSEFTVDVSSVEPPFEQVRRQIAEGAAKGELPPGHKLPTVRKLAADLELATNTVARAYRELETDAVIETHGRKGTFIASSKLGDSDTDLAAHDYARAARRRGLSLDEAIRLVEKHWPS